MLAGGRGQLRIFYVFVDDRTRYVSGQNDGHVTLPNHDKLLQLNKLIDRPTL